MKKYFIMSFFVLNANYYCIRLHITVTTPSFTLFLIENELLEEQLNAKAFEEALKHDFIITNNIDAQDYVIQENIPRNSEIQEIPVQEFFHKINHTTFIHEGKTIFRCSICGIMFAEEFYLKRHIEIIHEGKKPIHEEKKLIPERDKTFECKHYLITENICPSKFARLSDLRKHVKAVHERKKESECPHCPAKFSEISKVIIE